MDEKKVKMNISDASADFFAHEASINFNTTQFILDFKCVTPRIDPRSKDGAVLNLRHNVIMVDAYHALKLHELLGEIIKKYEKEFGKIDAPKQLKMIEKKRKKAEGKAAEINDSPSYLG